MTEDNEIQNDFEIHDKSIKDPDSEIAAKAIDISDAKVLIALFSAQNTSKQRINITALFDKSLTIDKKE